MINIKPISNKQNNKNQQGFTLIELMLYIGILSIFIIVVSQFMYIFVRSQAKNQVISEVEQQGQQMMNLITQTLRNSQSVSSPTKGNTDSSITVDVFDVASDPTIFALSGTVLQITQGANLPMSLSNSHILVSDLEFENVSKGKGPTTIKVNFTIDYNNPGNLFEYDYQKTFYDTASIKQ